jgi:hypothetical protein
MDHLQIGGTNGYVNTTKRAETCPFIFCNKYIPNNDKNLYLGGTFMDERKVVNIEAWVEDIEPTKKEKAKIWIEDKIIAGKKFVKEHGKETVITAIAVATTATSVYKTFKPTVYEQERKRIDHTYYDPSSGAHYQLKRKLTNKERQELVDRKRNGEKVLDILKEMKVAKR